MSGFRDYQRDEAFWTALEVWRRELRHVPGLRAELRRARCGDEVFLTSAFQRGLAPWLASRGFPLGHNEKRGLARGVGLLAHLDRTAGGTTLARQLADAPSGSQHVRDVRFRRLLAVDDYDDLYIMLLRLLRYLDGAANVRDLVTGAFFWGETIKRRWAEQYFTGTKKGD
jgi:CRISPR system Cascade subunit CasB